MSFGVWFRQWLNSFFRLLTIGAKKHKSEAQRKKERERRLKAKYSSANRYKIKKRRRRRRSSHSVQNQRIISAVFKFTAATLSILLLPFGLIDWGRKSVKAKRSATHSKARNGSSKNTSHSTERKAATSQASPTGTTVSTKPKPSPSRTSASTNPKASQPKETVTKVVTSEPSETPVFSGSSSIFAEPSEAKEKPQTIEEQTVAEPDENTPKSKPKHENDQYIRKRMIIAGSYYCEKAVLDALEVGSQIDLEAEPDNPYDKDAVKLTYQGEKIGYIAKQDKLPFVTCLRLKRKIYGVITAIINEDGRVKYEYETWFDSTK